MTKALAESFFRHEYGKIVATLARRVGVQHLDAVEDAVQQALVRATETWPVGGLPDRPSAWLFRVASNHLLSELRKSAGRLRILEGQAAAVALVDDQTEPHFAQEIADDLLRMLFLCCDDNLPLESQTALALKTLCGFGVREIALRLFTTEANVYKRLARARARLQEAPPDPAAIGLEELSARRSAVHRVLYVLFTEGHLSSHDDAALRRDLCEEALRLAHLLAAHAVGATTETYALVALMHLHLARLPARIGEEGTLLLLEEQDRTRWDQGHIRAGVEWLARSAEGEEFTRFHAEAGIAAEHCLAPSFEATRWDRIVEGYALLESLAPSPLHRLNRALALAEDEGPDAGLALLEGLAPPTWLEGSYLWTAALADLHRRCGHVDDATRYGQLALDLAPTTAVREALARRLGASAE